MALSIDMRLKVAGEGIEQGEEGRGKKYDKKYDNIVCTKRSGEKHVLNY